MARLVCDLSKSVDHGDFMRTVMLRTGKVRPIGDGKFGARQVIFDNGTKACLKVQLHSNQKFHGITKDTQHMREVAAYQLDWKLLHFDLVPPTTLTIYEGKPASISSWVTGSTSAGIVERVFDKTQDDWKHRVALFATKVDVNALRRSCIMDLIINNTDRHAKNCLFDPFAKKVWCIDNGLAFGPYFKRYYNVFHRFLFRKNLTLKPDEADRLGRISLEDLRDVLTRYLRGREIEDVYLRLQWVLEQPNLAFEAISDGHEGKKDFPSKKAWFEQRMSKGPRNRVLAKITDMGGTAGLTR